MKSLSLVFCIIKTSLVNTGKDIWCTQKDVDDDISSNASLYHFHIIYVSCPTTPINLHMMLQTFSPAS